MVGQGSVRIGIVGCGYQGRLIARAIARTDDLQVVACADPDKDAAAEVAAVGGDAGVYVSADELLEKGKIDAVIIATPHDVLCEIALAAIGAGKHVLAEKPIAMNGRQAAMIEKAVAETALCYMSGYSLRFFVVQKQVYDLLAAGVAGKIEAITAGIGTQPLSGWLGDSQTGGGPLLYLGSHLVDEILWFSQDDPVQVYADVRTRSDTETDETSLFQIRFAEGAIAQCLVTQAAESWFDFVNIYGRDGHISLTSSYWLQYQISVSSKAIQAYAQPTTICPRLTDDPIMMMLVPELEEFSAAIHEGRQPAITATDGKQVLKVLDAVVESGKTGRPVGLG